MHSLNHTGRKGRENCNPITRSSGTEQEDAGISSLPFAYSFNVLINYVNKLNRYFTKLLT